MSPRSSQQNQNLRIQAEERILGTALHLFASRGYGGTSVRMIAKDAGISLGLMYNYFESKEVLLMTLFMQSMADLKAAYGSGTHALSGKEEFRNLLENIQNSIQQNPNSWKLFYSLRMQNEALEVLGPAFDGANNMIAKKLEKISKSLSLSQPEAKARVFSASIDGICQRFLIDPSHYPIHETFLILINNTSNI